MTDTPICSATRVVVKRLQRAIDEADLPVTADANELGHLVLTINYGMTVQASTGATLKNLERIAKAVLKDWPS